MSSYHTSNQFKLRFEAISSSNSEDTELDDILIYDANALLETNSITTHQKIITVPQSHDATLPLLISTTLENPESVQDDTLDVTLLQNGYRLPYMIESWNKQTGSLVLWVLPANNHEIVLQYGGVPQTVDDSIWDAFSHVYLLHTSGSDLAGNAHAYFHDSHTAINSPYSDYTTPRTLTILFEEDGDSGMLWNNGPGTSAYRDENISVDDGTITFWSDHEDGTEFRVQHNIEAGTHVASYSFLPSSNGTILREFYVDGMLVGIDDSGAKSNMNPNKLFIGADQDGTSYRVAGDNFSGNIRAVLYSESANITSLHDALLPTLVQSAETSNTSQQTDVILDGYNLYEKITLDDSYGVTLVLTSLNFPVFATTDGTILNHWSNYNGYWVDVPPRTSVIYSYQGVADTSDDSAWFDYAAVYFADNVDVTGKNTMNIHGDPIFDDYMRLDGDDYLTIKNPTHNLLPLAVTVLVLIDDPTEGPIWQLDTTKSNYHDEVLSIIHDDTSKSIIANTNHYGITHTMSHPIQNGLHAATYIINTDNTRSLYVDGELVQQDAVESLLPITPNRMSIGTDYGFRNNIFAYYTGDIGAVMYSDIIPSEYEIQTLHKSLLATQ